METILFQTSLVAAFVAGIVALFAPCCITFLLPAYLGNVFKEKEKVLLMTLIFGLGIFVVMMPAVLGVAALSKFLFVYHNEIYVLGGFIMILTAIITFLGIKLPMPTFRKKSAQSSDPLSVFLLGITSGITSACCAPVLIGILTLTFLSPNFFGALGIGATYVLGMVTPLFIISLFLAGKADKFLFLKKPILSFSLFGKRYVVLVSNLIASIIFLATGLLILFLKATGRLSMGDVDGFSKLITNTAGQVNTLIGNNIFINIGFVLVVLLFLLLIVKRLLKGGETE